MNRHNGPSGNFSDNDSAGSRAYDYDRGSSSRRGRGASAPRPTTPEGTVDERAARPSFAVDPWSLLRPAAKRWYWLLFASVLGAIAGAVIGLALWKTYYTATAQLIEHKLPVATDAYTPQQLVGPTLVGMIKSPEIMKNIAQRMAQQGKRAAGSVDAVPERMSQIVTITAKGVDPKTAIELANLYNEEVIKFTQEHQRKEAEEAARLVAAELQTAQQKLSAARKQLADAAPAGMSLHALEDVAGGGPTPISAAQLQKQAERLDAAREKLNELLQKYTEAWPEVKAQRQLIAELETQLQLKMDASRAPKQGGAFAGGTPSTGTPSREDWEIAAYNVRTLDNYTQQLEARQRAIQVFTDSPPGNFQVMQPANVDTVARHDPWIKVGLLAGFFGVLGMVGAGAELLRRELFDTRLKTDADVARVTGLPVLANLGDIRQMSVATREAWAFRAWIALQDRLAYSPNHGLICGITSSNSGDGRSTWIGLLAGAARKCGFRVLTIATRPTADAPVMAEETTTEAAVPAPEVEQEEPELVGAQAATANGVHARTATPEPSRKARGGEAGAHGMNGANGHASSAILSHPNDLTGGKSFAGDSEFTALTASALFTPAMVTEKLMGTETDPLVHIPLPGWTWNLERRKQWQGALNVWRKIDNVVILVELPPASMPESVLLAQNLPNLLWLVEANKSDAIDTRAQLQTLRHARCNLVGSVINRAMAPVANGRFSRWIGCLALFGLLGLGLAHQPVMAQQPPVSAPATAPQAEMVAANFATSPGASSVSAFSVNSPLQRAEWQKKLTLGPGDVLTLALYGEPDLTQENVAVGPDGRISFLEANDIMAAGLTVDELRERFNDELGKYRRAPQAIVLPVAYKSKKYFVLGRVAQRGSFTLDRPMTLLEAVARAGGLETGLATDRSLIELADLKRSFLSRGGQRMKVDFEKLFLDGDLSQNVPLEPNDYIYFPGGGEREVYVLGAVRAPGAHTFQTGVGVVGAIAARGGFSERAWTKRVLVVRGGLGSPETFKVDAGDVLNGRAPDVMLQPKDIVYVSDRPWIYAEELLDAATNAFVTSAIVVWTSDKVSDPTR